MFEAADRVLYESILDAFVNKLHNLGCAEAFLTSCINSEKYKKFSVNGLALINRGTVCSFFFVFVKLTVCLDRICRPGPKKVVRKLKWGTINADKYLGVYQKVPSALVLQSIP